MGQAMAGRVLSLPAKQGPSKAGRLNFLASFFKTKNEVGPRGQSPYSNFPPTPFPKVPIPVYISEMADGSLHHKSGQVIRAVVASFNNLSPRYAYYHIKYPKEYHM